MKKDLIVKLIRGFKFIWKEAKKPVLHTRFDGDITLIPKKNAEETGKPKLSLNFDLRFGLLQSLLALFALSALLRILLK